MMMIVFSFLLSFQLFNEGVRKNNTDNMMAGRTTFAPLFYCGHHPKYQRLLMERVNYSAEVSDYLWKTESHSSFGISFGGQGGDFIHEEVNKTIKSFLPPSCMPTKQTWVNIIRKAKTIEMLKNSLLANCVIKLEI